MSEQQRQQLLDLMKIHYGFSSFRPGQEMAISAIMQNRDTLVIMPTGGGKSLCYQLPALILPGLTIVISPLIALMKDQVDQLQKRGLPASFINSSLSPAETEKRLIEMTEGKHKLVYIAPERFYNQEFVQALSKIKVSLFAIDEAHCISQWGHDFRPSYLRLKQAVESVGRPIIMALTATATPEVRQDIKKQLNMKEPAEIITGFKRPNLQFAATQANEAQKYQIILDTLMNMPEASGIIYSATRAKTDGIVQLLLDNGFNAVSYHAGLEPAERQQAQNDFMKGRVPIMVATNAFGMGIDKPDIRFVIHADLPGTLESYYQEAGRAGRDNKPSLCLLLYHPRDRYLREFFIKGDNPPSNLILDIYELLSESVDDKVLVTYAELKNQLNEDVPEMAIGTAIKVLETAGYLRRSKETAGQASLKLLVSFEQAVQAIGSKARGMGQLLAMLQERYASELLSGWQTNLEETAELLNQKKAGFLRLIKKLQEAGMLEYTPPFRGTAIDILQRKPREEVQLNFTQLKEKLSSAYDKLDKMERYVFQKTCRQKYLLDYFGDLSAEPCGKCDVCLYGNRLAERPVVNKEKKVWKNLEKNKNFSEKEMTVVPHSENFPLTTKLTQLLTFELLQKNLSLEEIAQERNFVVGTIVGHICYLLEKKLPVNLDRLVTIEKQKRIAKALRKAKTELLSEMKEILDDDISYDEIKMTLAKIKASS